MTEMRRPCTNADVLRIRALTPTGLAEILWPLVDHGDQEGIEALSELTARSTKLAAVNQLARSVLDKGCATGNGTTLATKVIAILEGET